MQNKIKLFENKKVRTVWNENEEEWYFSVVDVVENKALHIRKSI